MPSFFNLYDFIAKYQSEINHLSEIFPQIQTDNIALCFHENDCDFGLTISRLSTETSSSIIEKAVKHSARNVKSGVKKQKNRSFRSSSSANTIKISMELNEETVVSPVISSPPLHENVSFPPAIVETVNEDHIIFEPRECVFFENSCKILIRNVESPCVVFPFSVTSQIASIPISFP